jgi:hypothetical protein
MGRNAAKESWGIDLTVPIGIVKATLRVAATLLGAILLVLGVLPVFGAGYNPAWPVVLVVAGYAIGYRLGVRPLRMQYAKRRT